jgi:hypothetical protein
MSKDIVVLHRGDWAWAQSAYQSGIMSIGDIAKELGESIGKLTAYAQRNGWVRDPAGPTRAKLERQAVLAEQALVEQKKIERITAYQQAAVLRDHRADIQHARRLAQTLLAELTEISLNVALFDELGDALRSEDDRGRDKLNDMYRKVLKLPERSATLASLAQTLKVLIMLERQAFDIEGMLVDPEATRPQVEVTKGLDALMDKFNQVLGMQAPAPAPELTQVIDVSPSN